jgi:NAD(P)H-flavin reductase
MSSWSKATLIHNQIIAPGLHQMALKVPPEVADAFHRPGQYHRVRVTHEKEALFAMASAPGGDVFEYLIRSTEGVSSQWAQLDPGAEVEVSFPQGPGFPLELAHGRTLLLVGTGTGFAPLRSVVHALRPQRSLYGPIHGLYGAHSPSHLAWRQEFTELIAEDVHIVSTVSVPDSTWSGEIGRVQHLVTRLPSRDAVAFLCGQTEMVAAVSRQLMEQGLAASQIFLNF